MRIIFDAMGGDNAPDETLKGARLARDEYGVEITLVGDEPLLTERAAALSVDLAGLEDVYKRQALRRAAASLHQGHRRPAGKAGAPQDPLLLLPAKGAGAGVGEGRRPPQKNS